MTLETMELIDSLLEGEAGSMTEQSFAQLQDVLRSDPKALAYYCEQAEIHGRLAWELGDPENQYASVNVPNISTPTVQKRKPLIHSPVLWAGVAACLAVALIFTLRQGLENTPESLTSTTIPTEDKSAGAQIKNSPVARITNTREAVWTNAPHQSGDWLSPGIVKLHSGSAEIIFDSGAQIILQGPAELKLITPHHADLLIGKATVKIPSQAAGFKLDTPSSIFSDQNSHFSIAVDSDKSSEIHVIKGLVEATPKTNSELTRVLSRQESARITNSTILADNRIKYSADSFDQALPRPSLPTSHYLHWSIDGEDQGKLAETGNHENTKFPATILARPGTSTHASADFITGKFGQAIQLNGRGAFLSSPFPGVAGSSARTVCFWVRIAPGTHNRHAYSMIAWGTPQTQKGEKWQVGWHRQGSVTGTAGAVRTEFGGGYIVGSTDLRDGRWHHIAVVYSGGKSSEVVEHIRQYVDGRLEKVSASQAVSINTVLTTKSARPTYIGRRLEDDYPEFSFKGAMDEIYIFPTALTPGQIEELYLNNRAPGETTEAAK
ncbi:hypothetical protein NT6N_26320 [Oceaniferula spumae]|uniref:LamG-like jellyroll fold domain-containing protein n=1 Tax=Oceaniferula spumae TaxID=2979115 RepID=A0AAT9FNW1_9BACT